MEVFEPLLFINQFLFFEYLFELTFGGRLCELSSFKLDLFKAPHEFVIKRSSSNKTKCFFITS